MWADLCLPGAWDLRDVSDFPLDQPNPQAAVTRSAAMMLDVLGPRKLPYVSAADVISGKAPRGALAGKLVFVGITYAASDKVTTPLDRAAARQPGRDRPVGPLHRLRRLRCCLPEWCGSPVYRCEAGAPLPHAAGQGRAWPPCPQHGR